MAVTINQDLLCSVVVLGALCFVWLYQTIRLPKQISIIVMEVSDILWNMNIRLGYRNNFAIYILQLKTMSVWNYASLWDGWYFAREFFNEDILSNHHKHIQSQNASIFFCCSFHWIKTVGCLMSSNLTNCHFSVIAVDTLAQITHLLNLDTFAQTRHFWSKI